MTANLKLARNEITAAFLDVWDAETPALNGGVIVPVAFDEMPFDKPSSGPWARLTIRHTSGRTATFPEEGVSRYEKTGIVIVSIFDPLDDGTDTNLGEELAMIAESAFEGKGTPSQVEFPDVFSGEAGTSTDADGGGPWFQTNVSAGFNYDQLSPAPSTSVSLFANLGAHFKLNEDNGSAIDEIAALNLTESGTIPSFVSGKIGSARGVYGAGDVHQRSIGIGEPFDLTAGAVDVSFFAWVRTPNAPNLDPTIVSIWGTVASEQAFFFRILTDVTGDFLHYGMGDGLGGSPSVLMDVDPFPLNQWVAVGFSYDASQNLVSLFFKEENEISRLVTGAGVSGGFQNSSRYIFALGGSLAGLTPFGGYIDSASWWFGRVLTKAEFDFLALGVDVEEFASIP